jgi:benzoate-CoA ligase
MDYLGITQPYNATSRFVDRPVKEGYGDQTAIYYEGQRITYRDVQRKVNQFGNALMSKGIGMENRILMICYDTPAFVTAFYGSIKIGAVPIPVNTNMTPFDYEYFLNNSRAKVLIVEADIWENIRDQRKRFIYLENTIAIGNEGSYRDCDDFFELLATQSDQLSPVLTEYDDAAFWLYTSGSTGNPKGAIHLQHDMEYAYDNYARNILNISENDITFSAAKLYFAYGLGNGLYFPFGANASTVLMKEHPSAENVFRTIETYRPTVFFGVPTLYGSMLDFASRSNRKYDLSSLRACVSAGEALPASFFVKWRELFGVEILDGIGSTEAAHIYLSNRLGEVKPGSTGKPVPGYEVKILDQDGKPAPVNKPGDLYLKGDSIAHCYWNMHEKNKEKIVGEWLNTGDKYYQDEEGYLWYFGRSDDMLKVGGIWVSPIEVEYTLLEHDDVLEVAVIGVEDENGLVKPKAYVVLKQSVSPSKELEEKLKEHVKSRLAHYKYPRYIEFVDEIPKTATGKIQRFKLRNARNQEVIK